MMVVPVTLEPTFRAGVATRLFEGDYFFPAAGRHYDVTSDGQRFLMVKPAIGNTQAQIILVQNWFEGAEAARSHHQLRDTRRAHSVERLDTRGT